MMSAPTTGSGLELGNKKAPSLSNSYTPLPRAIAEAWRALGSVSGNANTARSSQLIWCSKETDLAPDCGWPQCESTSQNQAEAKHSSWLSTHLWLLATGNCCRQFLGPSSSTVHPSRCISRQAGLLERLSADLVECGLGLPFQRTGLRSPPARSCLWTEACLLQQPSLFPWS